MFFYKRNSQKEKEQWHLWFAWHPVSVGKTNDDDYKMIWFEPVLRCGELSCGMDDEYWSWSYKELM